MAVTLTPGARELVRFDFPIIKAAPDGDGHMVVCGIVTSDRLDRDLERIDMDASRGWLQSWFDTGANVRLAHDPRRPIGKGVALDFKREGHFLTSIVVDRDARELVAAGVLTGYSVGITRPDFRPDPTGKALRIITSRPDGLTGLSEVSLVDRPSNPDCDVEIVRKVAVQVAKYITKSAKRRKAGKIAKGTGRPAVTKAAALAAWSREDAVRAMLTADLSSPDPGRRETARAILSRGVV